MSHDELIDFLNEKIGAKLHQLK